VNTEPQTVEIAVDWTEWYPVYYAEIATPHHEIIGRSPIAEIDADKWAWVQSVFAEFDKAEDFLRELCEPKK
jgi:hypothetical protein